MSRWLRDARLIPIVLIAVGCLFALKATGLWLDGGYTLGQRLSRGDSITVTTIPLLPATQLRSPTSPLEASSRPSGPRSWAQEMFNYPDITGSVPPSRLSTNEPMFGTGAVGSTKEPAKQPEKKDTKEANVKETKDAKDPKQPAAKEPAKTEADKSAGAEKPADLAARPDGGRAAPVSTAERAILERLLERRQELDARARELDLRENLLKAAEKNLEAKLATLKAKETGGPRKDEAEAARFKGLITMYETMKPKDAAKIFERLEIKVLVEVASQINPRRMSEIMALMSPEAAERLTLEFASRSDTDKSQKPADLPKIEGRASGS